MVIPHKTTANSMSPALGVVRRDIDVRPPLYLPQSVVPPGTRITGISSLSNPGFNGIDS
ncbi:MAG: hypothetical protein JRI77_06755 [Deltaproteobacteria bacterium]|nr:hypothetical protein [Deltaproteobacteria bacterium]